MRSLARSVGIGIMVLAWVLSFPRAWAGSTQATVSGGLSFFQADTNGLIAQTGYFLMFQAEPKEGFIRPTYGAIIDFSSSTNRLLDGHMFGGLEMIANKASYIKPFLGAKGDLGWANFATSAASYNSFVFGFDLEGGLEFRFADNDNAVGFRIITTYRWLMNGVGGGLLGSDLNAVMASVGLTF